MKHLEEILEGLFNEKPQVGLPVVLKVFLSEIKAKYGKFQNVQVTNKDDLDEFENIITDFQSDTKINWSKITKSVVGFRYRAFSEKSGYSYDKVGVLCYGNNYIIPLTTFPHRGKQIIQFTPSTITKKAIKEIYKEEEVLGLRITDSQFWILPITPEEFADVWADIRWH